MTAFCGTVNETEFLVDPTGNRRWAIVPLDDDFYIDYEEIKSFDFSQLWAQINHCVEEMIKDGKSYSECFRLNRQELIELEKRNGEYLKPLPAQREIEDILSFESNNSFIIEYSEQTTSEFIDNWNTYLKKYSAIQVGKALDFLGVKTIKKYVNGVQKRVRILPTKTWVGFKQDTFE